MLRGNHLIPPITCHQRNQAGQDEKYLRERGVENSDLILEQNDAKTAKQALKLNDEKCQPGEQWQRARRNVVAEPNQCGEQHHSANAG